MLNLSISLSLFSRRKLESGVCLIVIPASRKTLSSGDQLPVLILLTADKLYLLDSGTSTLQQHFNVEQCKLEKKESSHEGVTELILAPHSSNEENPVPSSNQAVEYYLRLSQVEAQELSSTASGNTDTAEDKCDHFLSIVLCVSEEEASLLLFTFHSIKCHILEPDLSFCVYASLLAATKEESFFSVFSHPFS